MDELTEAPTEDIEVQEDPSLLEEAEEHADTGDAEHK